MIFIIITITIIIIIIIPKLNFMGLAASLQIYNCISSEDIYIYIFFLI